MATAQQRISVITLGVKEIERSARFYQAGFGWKPVYEDAQIVFYQMNGLMLATFLLASLQVDMGRSGLVTPGALALAHNVGDRLEVEPLMLRLAAAGGRIIRPADAPPHGGLRGYVADPDDHAWGLPGIRHGRSMPRDVCASRSRR